MRCSHSCPQPLVEASLLSMQRRGSWLLRYVNGVVRAVAVRCPSVFLAQVWEETIIFMPKDSRMVFLRCATLFTGTGTERTPQRLETLWRRRGMHLPVRTSLPAPTLMLAQRTVGRLGRPRLRATRSTPTRSLCVIMHRSLPPFPLCAAPRCPTPSSLRSGCRTFIPSPAMWCTLVSGTALGGTMRGISAERYTDGVQGWAA